MKTFFYLPIFLLAMLACSKDSENNPILNGKWKLTEALVSSGGGNGNWTVVQNGYVLSLNSNNTYSTTEFSECNSGSFSVANSIITYSNSCGNTTIPNKFKIVSYDAKELILHDENCIEECQYKFKRVE